jgi:hypothetical protein
MLPYRIANQVMPSRLPHIAVALGDGLGDAQIQLMATGKPRLLLATLPASTSAVQHEYLTCDSNCPQSAQPWAVPVISYLECGTRDCSVGVMARVPRLMTFA